jgi:hypothetical protein
MKNLLLSFILFFSVSQVLNAQSPSQFKDIEFYYFHGTHRCATCRAVENVTREALKQYYGDRIALKSVNREEKQNSTLVKKYQITGQTLLLVKGNQKVDLTNVAFMNAERNPKRLKAKIKESIGQL